LQCKCLVGAIRESPSFSWLEFFRLYARFLLIRRFASFEKFPAQLILILTDFALLLGTRRRERRRGAHDIIIYISRALLTCQFCAILRRSFLIGRVRGFAQNYLRNFFPIILLL
jgi:hypothetical protein